MQSISQLFIFNQFIPVIKKIKLQNEFRWGKNRENLCFCYGEEKKLTKKSFLVYCLGFDLFKCFGLLYACWTRSQLFSFTSTAWWWLWTSRNSTPWRIPSWSCTNFDWNCFIVNVNYGFLFKAPIHYKFGYSVHDPHTGDKKEAWEHRSGDEVKGNRTMYLKVVPVFKQHLNYFFQDPTH